MTTFAFLEGIGEGPIISRRFRRQLEAVGWQHVAVEQADVIITHSGGLYLLPSSTQAQLFIHIHASQNMPLKRLAIAHNRKIRYDMIKRYQKGWRQVIRGILSLGANGWYWLNLPRSLRMRRGFVASDNFCAQLPAGQHVFIHGFGDDLSDPGYFLRLANTHHIFVSIKNGHDDCWRDPSPYVATVRTFIGKS